MMGVRRHRHKNPTTTIDLEFTIQLSPDELDGGFIAECLELPGCISDGDTQEEALDNIRDAIQGVLVVLYEEMKKNAKAPTEPADLSPQAERKSLTLSVC